ncbi:MAG: J domain-containing protein [Actinobacteria bacterium]|nr:J domain-containing protein [Actinomycetota bacterium]
MADDPYQVLGVERDADPAAIRRAYLAQLRANHPDVRPGDAAAEERTRRLNQAWDEIRRQAPGGVPRTPAPLTRQQPAARAYSDQQRDFRAAFTTATLRIALAVVALGLVLLMVGQ